jgi:hypothetical protein
MATDDPMPSGSEDTRSGTHELPGPRDAGWPLGERVLVLLIALAAFGYFPYRIFEPWDPWPQETFWPRVGMAVCTGLFLLWATGFVCWPSLFGGAACQKRAAGPPTENTPPGDI